MEERKLNWKKVFGCIFIICLLVFGIYCFKTDIFENNKVEDEALVELEETNTINTEEVVEEPETIEEDTYYLNNLSVPVYKINEKNIKIPILIYHAFGTPMPADDEYKLFSCKANFEENVTTMLTDGYTFIHLEDLYKYYNGEVGLPEKVALITMDDRMAWLLYRSLSCIKSI